MGLHDLERGDEVGWSEQSLSGADKEEMMRSWSRERWGTEKNREAVGVSRWNGRRRW